MYLQSTDKTTFVEDKHYNKPSAIHSYLRDRLVQHVVKYKIVLYIADSFCNSTIRTRSLSTHNFFFSYHFLYVLPTFKFTKGN